MRIRSAITAVFCAAAMGVLVAIAKADEVIAFQKPAAGAPEARTGADPTNVNAVVWYRFQRAKADDYAARLIGGFDRKEATYIEGRKLYENAMRLYNAYIDQVLFMMVEKQNGDLSPSAKAAADAAKQFEEFVDKNTQTKAIVAALPVALQLVEYGIKFFDLFQNRARQKRESQAKNLAPAIRWRTWATMVEEVRPTTDNTQSDLAPTQQIVTVFAGRQ